MSKFETKNDLRLTIKAEEKEILVDEVCCTSINIILKNDGKIMTSFLGAHNPEIIKNLEKTLKLYFKNIKKVLRAKQKEETCCCGNESCQGECHEHSCHCGDDCNCHDDKSCGCHDGDKCDCDVKHGECECGHEHNKTTQGATKKQSTQKKSTAAKTSSVKKRTSNKTNK